MSALGHIGSVVHEQQQWDVSIQDGHVVLTRCCGPFALPAGQISIFGGCAASVAKLLVKAAKATKPSAERSGA